MKVHAAVLETMGATRPNATSRPLRIDELELAPPGPNEILVRIKAAGLCHSDLSVINGDRPRSNAKWLSGTKPPASSSNLAMG